MHLVDPRRKIIIKISMPMRVMSLWFALISASTTAIPLRDVDSASGRGSTERVLIASGASRSRVGWTIGTEQDSSDLRAKFKVNLRQCNIDVLEQTALAVSDPASSRYGNYFSDAQVCEIVSCPNRKEAVRGVLEWLLGPRVEGGQTVQELMEAGEQGQWLRSEAGRGDEIYDVAAKVSCSHVAVSMSVTAAAAVFPEAGFRPHFKTSRSSAKGKGRAVLRATGDVFIPESLSRHVEFVSGLTELWPGDGMGKLDGARAGLGGAGGMETGDFTEVIIQPRTLRTLYSIPEEERGGWAGRGNNRQGVVAFDDFFLPADLCAAHNLLGRSTLSEWLEAPDVTILGPEFDPEADEVESDLDTQYMTLMGAGVPVTFANHDSGQWVLDWAQDAAEGDLTPERGGPLVWSISYGFPEEWQCYISDGVCSNGGRNGDSLHGYDPMMYMTRSNEELTKLALLGVSVLVSSGDDGAGQLATCPVDPRFPVDVSGGVVEGAETTCPFDNREDCKCGSFQLELQQNSTASSRCILPLGLVESALGIEAPGADCVEILSSSDCLDLLNNIENTTLLSLEGVQEGDRDVTTSSACQMHFSVANASFYSDCECGAVPTTTVGNCSISGYTFQKGRDGSTPFAPLFPGSSPWVTSVGATQVAWDLEGSCLEADLLGPNSAQNAETAVNKFTGGFDGGGGFSTLFEAPEYQKTSVERYVSSQAIPPRETFNSTNRGFPDVSAAGHNYVIVTGGKVNQIGGTSASAPALAGMVSLMNERLLAAGKPPLGFLNPALYKAAEDGAPVFQPILPKTYDFSGTSLEKTLGPTYQVGSNKCSRYSCCQIGYDGSPDGSWDPVTGLGTINYQALAEYLNVPPAPIPPAPGPGHDRYHAAYVAWIVVLAFSLASVVTFLVYEHRPKLLLSAVHLGKSMRDVSHAGGDMSGFDSDEGGASGWMGGVASGGFGRRKTRGRDRPRGALTEMVMESEFGGLGDNADYRLLEDDNDGQVDEEKERESARRNV